MTDLPWILALAAAGLAGGMVIARRRSAAVWLMWLALPFLGLFAILAIEAGQDGGSAHRADKVAFGFVLYSLLVAPPWLGANLLGWLLGKKMRNRRGPRPQPLPQAEAIPAATADSGLPDWDRIDTPPVELWDLGKRLNAYAARGGIDPAALPGFDYPPGGSGECVIQDKFGYVYLRLVEGRTAIEESSSNAERLCYQILRHHAEDQARQRLAEGALGPAAGEAAVRAEIAAILTAMDPRWGRFFARMPMRPSPHDGHV